jgi:endonuclease/exonuclease/phosphatase (EEP) superfamily protein YafD
MSRAELIHELETVDADVLTLQEISIYDHLNMKPFFAAYPHQLLCDSGSDYEIGLLSRFPIVPGTETCLTEERLAAAQIVMPDGNHRWLVSLHLGWPFPADQHEQAELVAKWLRTLDDPVMIGGDFNMVPWADSVRLIAKAARAERVGPYRATFPDSGPLLPLPIDHIFLPSSAHARVEARPRAGSDHLGLVARFTP